MADDLLSRSNKIWDSRAKEYSTDVQLVYKEALKLQLLMETVQPEFRCLDIGSASGIFSLAISPKVKEVFAMDLSYTMANLLSNLIKDEKIKNIIPLQQNGEFLGIRSSSINLAFCYATLSLVPDPLKLLSEVQRVLVPGGKAILDITNKYNLTQVYWSRFYLKNGYIAQRCFSYSQIHSIFDGLGFRVIKMVPVGLMDQFRYMPGIHRMKFIDKWVHQYQGIKPDRDARWSSMLPRLANHWYFIIEKLSEE